MTEEAKSLQEQIVTLRLRIDQQGEAMAALVRHYVEHEIATVMKGRLPTSEVTDWATLECEKAKQRKKDWREIFMHSLKLGSAATAAVVCVALWEAFKSKITSNHQP
jgi:hypothetical protein